MVIEAQWTDSIENIAYVYFCVQVSSFHISIETLNSLVTSTLILTLATQVPVKALHPEHNNNNKRITQEQKHKTKLLFQSKR